MRDGQWAGSRDLQRLPSPHGRFDWSVSEAFGLASPIRACPGMSQSIEPPGVVGILVLKSGKFGSIEAIAPLSGLTSRNVTEIGSAHVTAIHRRPVDIPWRIRLPIARARPVDARRSISRR